ncbi:MAG: S8 family serine peptidase [Rhodothermales bacterium]|nr:S8 family serine peptidase [Rhodothermales bacterium]
MKANSLLKQTLLAATLAWGAAGMEASAQDSYLVRARDGQMEAAVSRITAAGGTVTRDLSSIQMVAVATSNPRFVADLSGDASIEFLTSNPTVRWVNPIKREAVLTQDFSNPPASGDDDFFFDLQWGHDAVDAVEAWNQGARGKGVTVAVLDSGVDCDHPDIAPNLMLAKSASFVAGEAVCVQPGFFFNHGTHVAGTVLAADNGIGTIGVAPEAKLIAVKVLSEFTGSGSFDGVIAGIVHAVDQGADVINMSLGALFPKAGQFDGAQKEVRAALEVATAYARAHDVLVIASAGNSATNLDAGYIHLPSDADDVLSISATTPIGWALDPSTNLDIPTSYTNYGKNSIDFAGPGGDALYPGNENCLVGGLVRPCWVFDLVFSTIADGWGWAGGTSMAAPHAAGVAAIIRGKYPNADIYRVRDIMKNWSDKLGDNPGNDTYFGWGRVDAIQGITGSAGELTLDTPAMERLAADLPTEFSLTQNYPNPFNPTTAIVFGLPEQANTRLAVYDLLGREVAVLVDGALAAGTHEVQFQAHNLPSGAYFYKIEAGSFSQIRQMLLMK